MGRGSFVRKKGFARQFERSLDTAREEDRAYSGRTEICWRIKSNPITPSSRLLLAAYRGANHELAGKARKKRQAELEDFPVSP